MNIQGLFTYPIFLVFSSKLYLKTLVRFDVYAILLTIALIDPLKKYCERIHFIPTSFLTIFDISFTWPIVHCLFLFVYEFIY